MHLLFVFYTGKTESDVLLVFYLLAIATNSLFYNNLPFWNLQQWQRGPCLGAGGGSGGLALGAMDCRRAARYHPGIRKGEQFQVNVVRVCIECFV